MVCDRLMQKGTCPPRTDKELYAVEQRRHVIVKDAQEGKDAGYRSEGRKEGGERLALTASIESPKASGSSITTGSMMQGMPTT